MLGASIIVAVEQLLARQCRKSVCLQIATVTTLFVLLHAQYGRSQNLIVPQEYASFEAPGDNFYPFGITFSPPLSMRYQQVYASSDFPLSGPVIITQMLFRPDAYQGGAFSTVIPEVQIQLSTTSSAPDALNTTFSSNIGADDTIVFPKGPLALSSAFTGGPAYFDKPYDFDIVINFSTPFMYDPKKGNLLFDVSIFDGASALAFDATNLDDYTDGMSRQYTSNNVSETTADYVDSLGLVTEFTYSPVPEPSTIALLTLGALGLLARRRLSIGCMR